MRTVVENKIQNSIKECDSHIQKLTRGKKLLGEFFPLTVESFDGLDENKIEHIDQFIYRFTKLQDSIGLRLFPSIYKYIEDDFSTRPFLDILKRLEKLNVISDENNWQFFRNLRNNLAHDYPESIEQTIETLNILFNEWHKMEKIYIDANLYCKDKLKLV